MLQVQVLHASPNLVLSALRIRPWYCAPRETYPRRLVNDECQAHLSGLRSLRLKMMVESSLRSESATRYMVSAILESSRNRGLRPSAICGRSTGSAQDVVPRVSG